MTETFFPQEIHDQIIAATKKYPAGRAQSALKAALMITQKHYGYLSTESMDHIASLLEISPMTVYEVAHFYTLYHLKPVGTYEIAICTNVSCWLRGAPDLLALAAEKLGIAPGETSKDGQITLREVECLAACGQAPAAQINGRYCGPLTKENLTAWLEDQSQCLP